MLEVVHVALEHCITHAQLCILLSMFWSSAVCSVEPITLKYDVSEMSVSESDYSYSKCIYI